MTAHRIDGFLFDLLMAVMNSLAVWTDAAGDRRRGLAWRDAVTARMREAAEYVSYERLVADAAAELALPPEAAGTLFDRWNEMQPWPDSAALTVLPVPYGFVTNCSHRLADVAAERSGLRPAFVLSAEEAGRFKPHPDVYREALRRLGTEPARTHFVAGSPYDAAGAADAGLEAVLVVRRPEHGTGGPAIRAVRSLEEAVASIG